MTTNITDWVVKLGFDGSAVEQGHRRLNTMFARLNTSQARMDSARTSEMRKQTAELKKQQQIAGAAALARRPGMGGMKFPALERLDDRRFRAATPIMKSESKAQSLLNAIPQGNDPRLRIMREQVEATANRLKMLRSSLDNVSNSRGFDTVRRSLGELNAALNSSAAGIGRVNRQLSMQDHMARRLKGSLVNLAVGFTSVFAVIGAGRSFFKVGAEMESLNASMLAASGDSKAAAEDFKFVTDAALRLGVDLQESTRGYTQLGAAARAANFSADETKNVFLAITEASRAYGLSAERTNLVFLGFQQMISKGKISMEELRRQVGEQIPGAFSIAAKAMGVTTGELDRMVSKGELMPDKFITPFANAIRQAVRESGALDMAMKKVLASKSRFESMVQLSTKEGFASNAGLFRDSFQDLAVLVKENAPLFKVFGLAMAGAFKALVVVLDSVAFVLKPITVLCGELFDSMERASKIDVASSKLGTLDRILRRLKIGLLDMSIAWDEFMLKWDYASNLDFKAANQVSALSLERKMGTISPEEYAKQLEVLTKTEPTKEEYANKLASLATVDSGSQSKTLNVTDNSVNNFNLVGSPQENKRMLDDWWQDRLTLASGINP